MKSGSEERGAIEREIARIMSAPYTRELCPNEDGTWFARIVELPGCMTEGGTEAEALANLTDAMREWLHAQLEDGNSIPLPSSEQRYSGKLVLRMASTLHRDLAERASRAGISLNALICMELAKSAGIAAVKTVQVSYLLSDAAMDESSNLAALIGANESSMIQYAQYTLTEAADSDESPALSQVLAQRQFAKA
jgi:antitoxin HicB